MLGVRRLSLIIGGKVLVRDLDASFQTNQTWAVLGANGSGKTSLLHVLAGLQQPGTGEVLLNGVPLSSYPPRERAKAISILFQDSDETFPATVLEQTLTGRHPHRSRFQLPDAADIERARDALQQMDLVDMEQRWMATLSGGERRRVEIATLFVQDTPVLLMDEPTNHLDFRHQMLLMRQLAQRGQLRVLVLHDINLAVRFCTHALLLFGDGSSAQGPLSQTVTRTNLERLYRCPIREIDDGDVHGYLPE